MRKPQSASPESRGTGQEILSLSIDDPVEFLAGQPPELSEAEFRNLKRFHSRPREIEEMGWNFLRAPATRQG